METETTQKPAPVSIRYLKYAIGEIILVVIGILIALSINNWNEQRQLDGEIRKALRELRSNLSSDSLNIVNTHKIKSEDINIQLRVIHRLERGNIPYDSIEFDLGRVMIARRIALVDNGYQMMKKFGLERLNNEHLRNELLTYYTSSIKRINDDTADDDFEFQTVFLPYIRENFTDWNWNDRGSPTSYDDLKTDQYFLTSLKVNLKNEESTLQALEAGANKIQDIIPLLDKTLEEYE